VVRQWIVFEITPGVFDGIEFRGIRRQQDGVDGAGVVHELLDEPGTMGLEPVPDEDHRVGGWSCRRSWRKNATTTQALILALGWRRKYNCMRLHAGAMHNAAMTETF